jgi:hypothetical protein
LDRIGLCLKRLSQKLIHTGMPFIAGFEKGLGFGLYLMSQGPTELLQISVYVAN